jgi:carbamate kinase
MTSADTNGRGRKLAVVAIGGNSLIKDKAHQSVADQYAAAHESMTHIASLVEAGWDVVLTHGNGPQVGFMLRRSELAQHELHLIPLDYSGAHTQGSIGYMLQRALTNEFRRRGIDKHAVTLVTQTLVDRHDPAFQEPSKPIGSFLSATEAEQRQREDGWAMVEDAGRGWRRVVPSPAPQRIIEQEAIEELIDDGFLVISTGGGGIPVMEDDTGALVGVEAVIDKDLSAALLATSLNADLLLISTAVDRVAINFNKPDQQWLDEITLSQAKAYMAEGHFAKGSMEPKIQAIIGYLERGGRKAVITSPEQIARALRGEMGTAIVPDGTAPQQK